MENRIIPKSTLTLRKLGSKYMLVEPVSNCIDMTNVYSLNETAALMWETICKEDGSTPERLAERLCEEYRVDYARALRDVELQLDDWRKMGLIAWPENSN